MNLLIKPRHQKLKVKDEIISDYKDDLLFSLKIWKKEGREDLLRLARSVSDNKKLVDEILGYQ